MDAWRMRAQKSRLVNRTFPVGEDCVKAASIAGMARSVLVTGAADGIGRGIATRFATNGERVALLDYDRDKLEQTTADIAEATGAELLALHTDVRDAAAVDA